MKNIQDQKESSERKRAVKLFRDTESDTTPMPVWIQMKAGTMSENAYMAISVLAFRTFDPRKEWGDFKIADFRWARVALDLPDEELWKIVEELVNLNYIEVENDCLFLLEVRVTEEEIAEFDAKPLFQQFAEAGLSDEAVVEALKELKQKGLIEIVCGHPILKEVLHGAE